MTSPAAPESASAYTETWGLHMVAYAIDLVLYGVALVIPINHLSMKDTTATKTTTIPTLRDLTGKYSPVQFFAGRIWIHQFWFNLAPHGKKALFVVPVVLFSLGQLAFGVGCFDKARRSFNNRKRIDLIVDNEYNGIYGPEQTTSTVLTMYMVDLGLVNPSGRNGNRPNELYKHD
ncbi:hypothetical protein FB451DRAFT_1369263 [Mycena latifolia]|nr:hypothetical protein FB451DRAFT_1369263 [Mycena latifolia]